MSYVTKRYIYKKEKVLKKSMEINLKPLTGRKGMKLGKGTQETIKVKCLISSRIEDVVLHFLSSYLAYHHLTHRDE